VRPDDMTPTDAAHGFAATVTASEYRGRDFFGTARTAEGAELSFRAPNHMSAGTSVRLGASEDRVLVFAGAV